MAVVDCQQVTAWDIDPQVMESYKKEMEAMGFAVKTTMDAEEVAGIRLENTELHIRRD
ncbi:MAG: hypothetical protein JSV17_11305 [Candidatus Aminicenantes bacterium]|nr:MAG: hypothetical protein JSV17_11305 [Candidatus Aminicenantes bacterium]